MELQLWSGFRKSWDQVQTMCGKKDHVKYLYMKSRVRACVAEEMFLDTDPKGLPAPPPKRAPNRINWSSREDQLGRVAVWVPLICTIVHSRGSTCDLWSSGFRNSFKVVEGKFLLIYFRCLVIWCLYPVNLRELAKGFNPKFAELTTLIYQFLKLSYYIIEAGGDPYLVLCSSRNRLQKFCHTSCTFKVQSVY